jgi:hypothetical protein
MADNNGYEYLCEASIGEHSKCTICTKPLVDPVSIKCVRCGEKALERGHFHDHKTKFCPKADVLCASSDIKCPWIGPRDQLDKHLNTCLSNSLRPLITQIQNENQRLISQVNQQDTQIAGLQHENRQLRDQTKQVESKHITHTLTVLMNQSVIHSTEIIVCFSSLPFMIKPKESGCFDRYLFLFRTPAITRINMCETISAGDNKTSRWKNQFHL